MSIRRNCLTWLLICLAILSGCDSHEEEVAASLSDVVFVMDGGDEALAAMLAAPAETDPTEAPVWLRPVEGATLPAEVTALQWEAGSLVDGSLLPRSMPVAPMQRWFPADWTNLLIAPAYAHGTPVSGRATLLEVKNASGKRLLRVFTKGQSYVPTAAQWQSLRGAGKLTARLTAARFVDNKVVAGPWNAAAVQFEVAP
jgi:hypothetical protein